MTDYETADVNALINDCFHKAAAIGAGVDEQLGEQYLNWALMHCIEQLVRIRDEQRGVLCANNKKRRLQSI